MAFDKYEGWIDNKQFLFITEEEYTNFENTTPEFLGDLIDCVIDENNELISIVLGANLEKTSFLEHQFEGVKKSGIKSREEIIQTALLYLNSPYLWGGKTPLGIDCSGFTQMVYKLNGYDLKRDANQQALQGEVLSFIEECQQGDLAFFDNEEGKIIHVGIIMNDNYIIHSHGKVRIDRIDHTGIFNISTKKYSHKLRVIKSILP